MRETVLVHIVNFIHVVHYLDFILKRLQKEMVHVDFHWPRWDQMTGANFSHAVHNQPFYLILLFASMFLQDEILLMHPKVLIL